jgi:hypothetical protein
LLDVGGRVETGDWLSWRTALVFSGEALGGIRPLSGCGE